MGLSGDPLKEQMVALSLLDNDSLVLCNMAGLSKCLHKQSGDFTDFTATWEVLGEVLARSRDEGRQLSGFTSNREFFEFLVQFIKASLIRDSDEMEIEQAVVDGRFFQMPITDLLHSSYHYEYFSDGIRYAALTWSEVYAIKLLWWYAPDALLAIAEVQMARVSIEPQSADLMRLSVLSQIMREISFSIQFDIDHKQRSRLICSENGLLQWLGLNAIEKQLEKPAGLAIVLELVSEFSCPEQVRVLGWMVSRAAENAKEAEIYDGLVRALHETLPAAISGKELRYLIDSLRGHMWKLAWAEPWLFRDVVFPLLQNSRANFDDACDIWMQDLAGMLEPKPKDASRLFDLAREGQMTNITAFLFANSSTGRQQISLRLMQEILRRQKRIVQRPLASTSNWALWDDALTVAMWILGFTKWTQYYLQQCGIVSSELENLSCEARKLAMVRSMTEWRSVGVGESGQLAAFLDQVEELWALGEEPSA